MTPDCTAHTTVPCGSQTLMLTTPGSSRTKRELSSAHRLGLRAFWPASSSGSPLRSTARWATAAVSVHSGSETASSSSHDRPSPERAGEGGDPDQPNHESAGEPAQGQPSHEGLPLRSSAPRLARSSGTRSPETGRAKK